MPESARKISIARIVDLVAFDLIVGGLLTWAVIDNRRRWTVVVVLIPILLLINYWLGRRALDARKTASFASPAIYLCGLIYAIFWVIEGFMWDKVISVIAPLVLLIVSVHRIRRESSKKAGSENQS
jgi:membrane protein implicated in regulation of membrane protease activity